MVNEEIMLFPLRDFLAVRFALVLAVESDELATLSRRGGSASAPEPELGSWVPPPGCIEQPGAKADRPMRRPVWGAVALLRRHFQHAAGARGRRAGPASCAARRGA